MLSCIVSEIIVFLTFFWADFHSSLAPAQEAPNMFWPVVRWSALSAVVTYTAIYSYWRRMPNYQHQRRVNEIQVLPGRASLHVLSALSAAAPALHA